MLDKFKNLSKKNKIIVVIFSFILFPITIVLLGVYITVNGLKNKKNDQLVIGLILVSLVLIPITNYKGNNTVIKNNNEVAKNEIVKDDKDKIEESSTVYSTNPTPLNVKIEESMEQENGKVRFNIKTNLPDDVVLIVGISKINNGKYNGQSETTVKDGQALTEWFSNNGNALESGEYKLSISMSIPEFQSEKVQNILGKNGEYLRGDLVINKDGYSYVSMDKTINLHINSNLQNENINNQSNTLDDTETEIVSTDYIKQMASSLIETEINKRMNNTTLESIRVNENLGTNSKKDFVILADLSWSTMNLEKRTVEILEKYSDHLAATLSKKLENNSEIVFFWKAEYTGLDIKHSYYVKNGNAYKQ